MMLSRRHWLRVARYGVHLAVTGGLLAGLVGLLHTGRGRRRIASPRVAADETFRFRPPGALPEPQFLARCIHCCLCQDACRVGCIQISTDTDADRGTPFILPRMKGCTLCLECTQVCPTGALQPLTNRADVRMGVAVVDEQLCVSHLRTGACGACYTVCPLRGRAITQGLFNAPEVHAEHCAGCGLCEEVCIVPARAIRVHPRDTRDRPPPLAGSYRVPVSRAALARRHDTDSRGAA